MIKTVKHTPGPWAIFEHRDHSGLCIGPPYKEQYFTDGEVADVCTISGGRAKVTEQDKANARLIAAAPVLLAAAEAAYLKLLSLGFWDGRATAEGQALLSRLRDSIAAATGQDIETVQNEFERRAVVAKQGQK